jgi:hypothetical protein
MSEDQIKDEFICPITQIIMEDPILMPDKYSYERSAITQWLQQKGESPMTTEKMSINQGVTNHSLKCEIDKYVTKHGRGEPVQIILQSMKGQRITVSISLDANVDLLKELIHKKFNILPASQTLTYRNKVIKAGKLQEYQIEAKSVIYIGLNLIGGILNKLR